MSVQLRLLPEVLVLKNVGGGANDPETHALIARFATRKPVSHDHHRVVCLPVIGIVENLVNARFRNRVSRPKQRKGSVAVPPASTPRSTAMVRNCRVSIPPRDLILFGLKAPTGFPQIRPHPRTPLAATPTVFQSLPAALWDLKPVAVETEPPCRKLCIPERSVLSRGSHRDQRDGRYE